MKKLSLLLVCIPCLFFACSKSGSSSNSSGSITATINGTNLTFNANAVAINVSGGGVYSVAVSGFESASTSSGQVTISVAGSNVVTPGSYSNLNAAADEVSMVYSSPAGAAYAAIANPPAVKITSITSTNIQGTFSGVLTLYSGTSSATTATVTNGKFNVNFK